MSSTAWLLTSGLPRSVTTVKVARHRPIPLTLRLEELEERQLLAILTPAMVRAAQETAQSGSLSHDAGPVYYDYVERGELHGGRVSLDLAQQQYLAKTSLDIAVTSSSLLSNVQTIIDHGPTSNRIDLVLVGDGYTSRDLTAYSTQVNDLLAEFFALSPLNEYYTFFNVHRVDVVSNESGADGDPTQGVQRDTALDAAYWCGGIERLLCVDVTKVQAEADRAPDVDQILVLANSTKYGGAGYSSLDIGTVAGANGAAVEIAKHEFGHSFADLADEYDYGDGTTYTGSEPSGANVSIQTAAQMATARAKWHLWLDEPNVDTFEGAAYNQFGIYRPTFDSLMRSLGQPLEQVNVEQFVINAYKTVRPIDNATRDGTYHENDSFFVTPIAPVRHALDVQWFLDGVPIAGATGTVFDASSLRVSPGHYTLAVVVTDDTDMVRDEALRAQWLSDTRQWALDVAGTGMDIRLDPSASYVEDSAATILSPNATVTGPGPTAFAGGSVTVDYAAAGQLADRLSIQSQGTGTGQVGTSGAQVTYQGVVIGTFTGGTGTTPLTVSFNASATVAAVEAIVRNISFRTIGDNPSTTPRTVRIAIRNHDGSSSDSATMTVTVTARNDAPVLNTAPNPTLPAINEDTIHSSGVGVWALLSNAITDPDASALRGIAVVSAPTTNGSWQYSTNAGTTWSAFGAVSNSAARLLSDSADTRIRFVPAADFNGQATFTYRAWDRTQGPAGGTYNIITTGGTSSFSTATEAASITVRPVNDAPVLGGIGGTVKYVNNNPPFVLVPTATATDVDSPNFDTGELRVRITGKVGSTNRLFIGTGFTVNSSNQVLQGSTVIGTRSSDGIGTNPLVISFNASATSAVLQQLIRSIRFGTVGNEPGLRYVLFSMTDGDGGASLVRTRIVDAA